MSSHTPPPAFNYRDFMPLAIAETTKFYRRQDPSRFEYKELLSVATEALATSLGANYARIAIKGTLLDYIRDDQKLVHDVELTEDKYLSTAAELDDCLPTARGAKPKPCKFPSDNPLVEAWRKRHRVTVGPAPRRIRRRVRHPITGEMYELLPSRIATSLGYKVSTKHSKVSIAIERTTYKDGWSQTDSGWKRAKIEDDERQDFDPHGAPPAQRGEVEQGEYIGQGRERRFSVACYNGDEDHKSGLKVDLPPNWREPDAAFITPGGHRGRRQFRAEELVTMRCDGMVEVTQGGEPFARAPVEIIQRFAKPVKLTRAEAAIRSGRRTSDVKVDPRKFGLEPVPKDKLGAWRDELAEEASTCVDKDTGQREPTLRAPSWHRDAKEFPYVSWGLLKEAKAVRNEAAEMVTPRVTPPEIDRRSANAKRQARFRERRKALRFADRAEAISVGERDDPSSFRLLLRLPSGGSFGGRSYFLCPRRGTSRT